MNKHLQAENLGVLDFLRMIYHGHPEYSLIAVKTPINETVQAFIEFRQEQKMKERMDYKTFRMKERKIISCSIQWEQNIQMRHSLEEGEELAWAFPLLQVQDSEWTVILRSLFYLGNEVYDVPVEAQALSVKLQTKTITLMEEDTSGAIAYELFENGELLEEFECGDDVSFQSKLREKPDIKKLVSEPEEDEEYDIDLEAAEEDEDDGEYDLAEQPRVQFINDFFCELGIYLPACYPVTDNGKPTLVVEKASENMIQRADWVVIEEKLESETT